MKKITSQEVIPFAVSGTEKFVITPEGVLASDFAAGIIKERLGSQVTIIDMEPENIEVPAEAVVPEAPVAAPAEEVAPVETTPTPEPLPEEVVAPAAPTEAAV